MERSEIVPDDVFDSQQFGFSQAVVTSGGRTVHVSGQVAWNPHEVAAGSSLDEQVPAAFDRPPAATWLRVSGLADPSMLVEVEATAVIP